MTHLTLTIRLALPFAVTALLFAPGIGFAQTLYRCGKTFQDRPCDAGVEGKAIGKANIQSAAPASIDPVCAQQGNAAQKIRWDKEAGRSEAEQIGTATQRGLSSEFIRYVYAMPGSAAQVKARVEADCLVEREKERAARAAALAAQPAAKTTQSGASLEPGPAAPPPATKPRPNDDQNADAESSTGCMDSYGPSQPGNTRAAGGVITDGGRTTLKQPSDEPKSRPAKGC